MGGGNRSIHVTPDYRDPITTNVRQIRLGPSLSFDWVARGTYFFGNFSRNLPLCVALVFYIGVHTVRF